MQQSMGYFSIKFQKHNITLKPYTLSEVTSPNDLDAYQQKP